jgi:hypothetical protein
MKRRVFFVSDRTGITAETLGESLLTQFPHAEFVRTHIPFVDTLTVARHAAERIRQATESDPLPPLVFSTLTDNDIQHIIANSTRYVFDLFGTFIGPLESALAMESSHTAGRMHGIVDATLYERRLSALNFTLGHDDGVKTKDFAEADVVLMGVSRCGKTPTCLYLSMHFDLKAANYPLTDDDFQRPGLPAVLEPCRDKLYGLTIVPEQLSRIRRERRPHGRYATLGQCRTEVNSAEALYRRENIRYLDTTTISIEEIAAVIVRDMDLHRTKG